jgi:hypothetical protein
MFVDFLIRYIGPPNCVHYCVQLMFEDVVFETCVFVMFTLWSPPNHISIEWRGPIKKTRHYWGIYMQAHIDEQVLLVHLIL